MTITPHADTLMPELFHAEWAGLCTLRPNILIEGRPASTESALLFLQPHIRGPIVWKRRTGRLDVQPGVPSALIVEEVAMLTAAEQRGLRAWLDRVQTRAQVISTSTYPLFPQVARGLFDEVLYYRLNTMMLRVDAEPSVAVSCDQ